MAFSRLSFYNTIKNAKMLRLQEKLLKAIDKKIEID